MKDFNLFNRIYMEYIVFYSPKIAYRMTIRKLKHMEAEKHI